PLEVSREAIKSFGVRREAERHTAFLLRKVSARESAVVASLCRRSPNALVEKQAPIRLAPPVDTRKTGKYAIIPLLKLCVESLDTSDAPKRRPSFSMVYAASNIAVTIPPASRS